VTVGEQVSLLNEQYTLAVLSDTPGETLALIGAVDPGLCSECGQTVALTPANQQQIKAGRVALCVICYNEAAWRSIQ
jgi:hypothetical protein